MMILNETQTLRDKELSDLTGVGVDQIKKYKIASPETIRIFNGDSVPSTKQEIEELYRDYKSLNLVGYLRTLMYTSIYGRHEELIKLLRETQKKVCLDFGSGVGTHGIALAENKNIIHILDVPGPLLDFTMARFKHRGYAYTKHNNNGELPKNTFDVAVCTDVLEHVYDPAKELNRICESMKVGGKLHLQVSQMKKNSSGHFCSSIDKWNKDGPPYLSERFKKIGCTTYIKR